MERALKFALLAAGFAGLFLTLTWALYAAPYYVFGLQNFGLSRGEAAAGAGLSILCAAGIDLWS